MKTLPQLKKEHRYLSTGQKYEYLTEYFTVSLRLLWEEDLKCSIRNVKIKANSKLIDTIIRRFGNYEDSILDILIDSKEIDIHKDLNYFNKRIKEFDKTAEEYGLNKHNDKMWFYKKYVR